MRWNCHPMMAVTGSRCTASCALPPGAVANGMRPLPEGVRALVRIEHPSGEIDVTVDYETGADGFKLRSARLLRTARFLARGEVFVPGDIWRR
jgi:4-oxalomesaconate tautomerase